MEALHLLDFVVVDEYGQHGDYTMGRTLNVSRGGILMETHLEMQKGQWVMVTMELKNALLNVMGKIVYVSFANGRYRYGIEFFHVPEEDQERLNAYVEFFQSLQQGQDAESRIDGAS